MAAALLTGSMVAQAGVLVRITDAGLQNGTWDVTAINTIGADAALQLQPWFGDMSLAKEFATDVGVRLGYQSYGINGPFFEVTYDSTTSMGSIWTWQQIEGMAVPGTQYGYTPAVFAEASRVPEPATFGILGLGLVGVLCARIAQSRSRPLV